MKAYCLVSSKKPCKIWWETDNYSDAKILFYEGTGKHLYNFWNKTGSALELLLCFDTFPKSHLMQKRQCSLSCPKGRYISSNAHIAFLCHLLEENKSSNLRSVPYHTTLDFLFQQWWLDVFCSFLSVWVKKNKVDHNNFVFLISFNSY